MESSWAVAVRAIMPAVGCWICCAKRKGTVRAIEKNRGGRFEGREIVFATYHLVQEHGAVLGDLDVTSTGHEHLEGATGAKVALEHFHQALAGSDVLNVGAKRESVRS